MQFPICDRHDHYFGTAGKKGKIGQRERRVWFLDPPALAIVDGLQPHLGGNTAKNDLLAILRDLSNEDKHHKLLVVATIGLPTAFEFSGISTRLLDGSSNTYRALSFEPDAEIASIDFSEDLPETDVHVKAHVEGEIAFGNVGSPIHYNLVVATLEKAHDFIRDKALIPLEALL